MNLADWHQAAVALEFGLAAITLVALLWVVAPYGRHQRPGWGPTLSARAGWVIMESPAVVLFVAIFFIAPGTSQPVPLILLALWLLHYLYRTLIFPFRLAIGGKQVPWLIVALAIVFNGLNAWVNAGWIAWFGNYPVAWFCDPRFVVGLLVFFSGMAINHWADHRLIRLRAGRDGYQIPRGGLFERVCCPNYLGEIIQWSGWAILTWSWAGLAFAVYTLANLLPRALAHRRWYRQQFDDFPSDRRALIPYFL